MLNGWEASMVLRPASCPESWMSFPEPWVSCARVGSVFTGLWFRCVMLFSYTVLGTICICSGMAVLLLCVDCSLCSASVCYCYWCYCCTAVQINPAYEANRPVYESIYRPVRSSIRGSVYLINECYMGTTGQSKRQPAIDRSIDS